MTIDRKFFDEIHDRRIPGDIKYTPVEGVKDLIPMWIADMDFRCPPAIGEAMREASKREIFGYMAPDDEYYEAVIGWYEKRFGWKISKEEIAVMANGRCVESGTYEELMAKQGEFYKMKQAQG